MFLCFVAVASGLCRLPPELNWRHIFGAGVLGGIGFTMSVFYQQSRICGKCGGNKRLKMAIL